LATILFFRIVQSAGPIFLSQINYMIPVIALIAGVTFLSEALAGSVLVGLALILAGLAFSQGSPRRR
jgi:drug/metabolite transporter (DMT)-like permease